MTTIRAGKNGSRNGQRPQSGKQRKHASLDSPRDVLVHIESLKSFPLVLEWENVPADDYVNYALNVAVKASLEDMAHIASDSNPNKADRLRARTFLTRLNGPAKPPAPGSPAIVRRQEETSNGAAIKAMSRLIHAEARAGAILLLASEKFMAFATDGDDATAEDYHIAIGLHAAAQTGNDELQSSILQAEAIRSAMDAHTATSDDLHKCLGTCEFKCDEMAQLLELISHTWFEMAKARTKDDGVLHGKWAQLVATLKESPQSVLTMQREQAEAEREAASKFSLLESGAADELLAAWDAAWQAWVAIKEPALGAEERRAA